MLRKIKDSLRVSQNNSLLAKNKDDDKMTTVTTVIDHSPIDVPPPVQRKVEIKKVQVRLYNQCMSDNISVSCGVAIGLDWDYSEQEEQNIDEYELRRARESRRTISTFASTGRLTKTYRLATAIEGGSTHQEIEDMMIEVDAIQTRIINQLYGISNPFQYAKEVFVGGFSNLSEKINSTGASFKSVGVTKKMGKIWKAKSRKKAEQARAEIDEDQSNLNVVFSMDTIACTLMPPPPPGEGRIGGESDGSPSFMQHSPMPPPPASLAVKPLKSAMKKPKSGLHSMR
jgi:hypothetical protein